MSGNTSAAAGFLTPVVDTSLQGAALRAAFQATIVGLTQLDPTLVRPRWQIEPPPQPSSSTNWIAFGISLDTALSMPFISHDSDGDGSSTLSRQLYLDVLISSYGPDAEAIALRLQDGFSINQNMAPLNAQQIKLTDIGMVTALPDITNALWINRYDTTYRFTRQVDRTYNILNILSAPGTITSDDGTTATFDAAPPT